MKQDPEMCDGMMREGRWHIDVNDHDSNGAYKIYHDYGDGWQYVDYRDASDLMSIFEHLDGEPAKPRMNFKQREKLWALCGRYNVPFREDDYFVNPPNGMSAGWVEGWIGGHSHRRGQSKPTIYIGVSPEGDSHS